MAGRTGRGQRITLHDEIGSGLAAGLQSLKEVRLRRDGLPTELTTQRNGSSAIPSARSRWLRMTSLASTRDMPLRSSALSSMRAPARATF